MAISIKGVNTGVIRKSNNFIALAGNDSNLLIVFYVQ
ncbi:TPA: hypothetical protein IB163_005731, partial [Escherichia coli]|nr:hypothetical protein [Escherichia coli]HDP7147231.1 hypothetical protein [Escherichia coli]HDP7264581.1 hypothetical protein [Escherichia coli]